VIKLTPRETDALRAIYRFQEEHLRRPRYRELADMLGVRESWALHVTERLLNKGALEKPELFTVTEFGLRVACRSEATS